MKGKFNLIDLYEQMSAMRKMGPLAKIVDMIPGMAGMQLPKEMLDGQDEKLKKWNFIMDSCTKEELEDPDLISSGRMDRIVKGAGVQVSEVRELLKQHKQGKKMMKMMKGGGNMDKMMKKMKGKMPKM